MVLSDEMNGPPSDPVVVAENFLRLHEKDPAKGFVYLNEIKRVVGEGSNFLRVSLDDLTQYSPALSHEVMNNPLQVKFFDQAFINIAHELSGGKISLTSEDMHVRFTDYARYKKEVRDIRVSDVGRMVVTEGVLVRASKTLPEVSIAEFECLQCGATQIVPQVTNELTKPDLCAVGGCKNKAAKRFRFLERSSSYRNWQELRIQERSDDMTNTPQFIRIILTDELTGETRVGTRVSILGEVKIIERKSKESAFGRVLDIYIHANNLMTEDVDDKGLDLSLEDINEIRALSTDPDIHDMIRDSIAPSVHGYENIKAAIAAQLFGGVKKARGNHRIRGDIHLLIMGDPSTAKSQMTRNAAAIAPRVKITTGRLTSGVGLTAAVVRDDVSGNWALEAGALVLADGGIAIIDEFDKMQATDQVAIHEQMEQQTVSISKAGITATLNARTSILATANPKWGRYDDDKSVSENVDLTPAMMSRFDLIFIVKDEPEKNKDTSIADHIFNTELPPEKLTPEQSKLLKAPISPEILKKYIHYARMEIKPELTDGLRDLIVNYYVTKRDRQSKDEPIAVVARTLEGLIRFSEAHARMALRQEVSKSDVEFAIKMFEECQKEVSMDKESNKFDVDTIQLGRPKSKTKKMKAIFTMLKSLHDDSGEPIELSAIVERAVFQKYTEEDVKECLELLKRDSQIIEKRSGCFVPLKK